jgi:hypothetical protein
MGCLQRGQCEAGITMEMFSGMRTMQTFRKLPMTAPKRNSTKKIYSSIIEEHPRMNYMGFLYSFPLFLETKTIGGCAGRLTAGKP